MMLPTKVQLKFQRREAPRTGLFGTFGRAALERSPVSGVAEFIAIPSFASCPRSPSESVVVPRKAGSGEGRELGAKLNGAPNLAAFPGPLFAASHATRAAFWCAPASGLPAPQPRIGTQAQGNISSPRPAVQPRYQPPANQTAAK